jgi:hypothetical protein
MNRKILFAMIVSIVMWVAIFDVAWVGKFFRITGDFLPDDTWSGWHPGKIIFDIGTTNSGYYAWVDAMGYLSGYFWLGKVGWSTFSHGVVAVDIPPARINCPNNVFNNLNILCPLEGFAWSENSGWIGFSGSWIANGWGTSYASWVYYNPASGRIEGFAHSRSLGWVPFYAQAAPVTPVTPTTQTGILFNWVWLNFIWRIAIIGNIAGSRIYSVASQQLGFVFSSINQADILNIVRKNIALITRNVADLDLADPTPNNLNFMLIKWSDYDTSGGWWTWPATKRSIIVVWGDIILGGNPSDSHIQIGLPTEADRALIALQDENGNGGNIIIKENIGRIYAFLYAENTIYSWEKVGSTIVPYVASGAWNIPGNQLYIKGAMISKNTIGWSLQDPVICPVVIQNCTTANAQIYDVNYFRTYDPSDSDQKNVPYDDPRFWVAAGVIEFNPDLSTRPPPGIENILQ